MSPSRSASITSATCGLRTRCIVSTSRASRRHAGAQDLERDSPVPPVAGKEDNAHPALADPVEQAVIPELVRHQPLMVHGTFQITDAPFRIQPGSATRPGNA